MVTLVATRGQISTREDPMAKKDIADQCLCKATQGSPRLKDLRLLVRDAKYICRRCGRAAGG